METEILKTIVFSILRHSLSLIGGTIIATQHQNELNTLAGAIVAIIPVIISVYKDKKKQ